MAKTDREALRKAVADNLHTYLRKGVRFDRVVDSAHSDLEIDDIETLLRIHFVLTKAETDDEDVGVLDFMRELEARIRRMKTTTSPEAYEYRGEVRGRIDWQGTVKTRARAGRLSEPIFVCNQSEEHYNIDENLVLKRLLTIIHEIVTEDLEDVVDDPDDYNWLGPWVDSDREIAVEAESAVEMLDYIYEQNIYLQRINVEEADITDRTIESVKRSRSRFYQEAAILLDRYRQLMNQELDSDEAREILNNTIIGPEKAEVLFELYWVFRVLDAYEGVQYRVLTDSREDSSTVAIWEQDGFRFRLSHDATGEKLTFNESVGDEEIEADGYLFRMNEVLSQWQSLSEQMLDRSGSDSLWGGRPDIVLERYQTGESGEWVVDQVFIGEVKYTQSLDYAATGLRELMEYMAFVRRTATDEYVEASENLLDSVDVKGLLFVDDLGREISPNSEEKIEIVQYPHSPDKVF